MANNQWKLIFVKELEDYRSRILVLQNVNKLAAEDFQLLYNELIETLFKPGDNAIDDDGDTDESLTHEDLKDSGPDIIEALCIIFLSEGTYDSRCRVLVEMLATRLSVPRRDIDMIERKVVQLLLIDRQNHPQDQTLSSSTTSSSSVVLAEPDSTSEHVKKRSLSKKAKRIGYISMAAVTGGLVVGLTGGLAAPLVGAGLASVLSAIGIGGTATFLGSLSGIAIITSLFGAAGAGMTSYRMAYRTRGIKEFFFVSHANLISKDEEMAKLAREGSPTILNKFMFWKSKSSTPPNSPLKELETDMNDLSTENKGEKDADTSISVREQPAEAPMETDAVEFFKALRKDPSSPILEEQNCKVVISVSGWVNSYNDIIDPWRGLFKESDQYSVCWETPELMAVASALDQIVKMEAFSALSTQALANTFMAGLMSAMAWPALLLKGASVIDNPWSVAVDRAQKAGCVLADVLMAHTQGHRPVTLVGSGLGAIVIYHCLLELEIKSRETTDDTAEKRDSLFGIVHDVYIFGAPIVASEMEWQRARTIVAGRFVNAYSRSDWLLGFVMRATGNLTGIAGLGATLPVTIESIDCTDIVDGHASYSDPETVKQILEKIYDYKSIRVNTPNITPIYHTGTSMGLKVGSFDCDKYFRYLDASYRVDGEVGSDILITDEIESTQSFMEQYQAQLNHGTLMLANRQTQGRGRRGNKWIADGDGCLQFSLLLKSSRIDQNTAFLQYIAALAVCDSVKSCGKSSGIDVPVHIKWPNDVYVRYAGGNLKKIGGIMLSSSVGIPPGSASIIIGCGLNVYNETDFANLKSFTSDENCLLLSKEYLLSNIMLSFSEMYKEFVEKQSFEPFAVRYYSYWLHSGQEVDINNGDVKSRAIIEGLSKSGYLLAVDSKNRETRYELWPDGNSLDMMNNLIAQKKYV